MTENHHLPERPVQRRRRERLPLPLRPRQPGLQRIALPHELVNFRDDAALLGEGWKANHQVVEDTMIQIIHR